MMITIMTITIGMKEMILVLIRIIITIKLELIF